MSLEKPIKKRPSWDRYFMDLAELAATRATCDRGSDLKFMPGFKGVGAIVVRDKVILSTGYNGSPRGLDHCDDIGHEMVEGHCVRTVHAEANALAAAARFGVAIDGSTLYTTASPCYDCFKLLINAGIKRVVCGAFYSSRYGASEKVLTLAAQAGVKMEFLKTKDSIQEELVLGETKSSTRGIGFVRVRKVHPSAKVPSYARDGDAGLDLFAVEGATVEPGERVKVATGIAMEIPTGFVGLIWDKGGVATKKGLKVIGGVVDSGYRGEVFVVLANLSDGPVALMQGDKVAQILIQPVQKVNLEVVDELSSTQRGEDGFGSTDESPAKAEGFGEVGEIGEKFGLAGEDGSWEEPIPAEPKSRW